VASTLTTSDTPTVLKKLIRPIRSPDHLVRALSLSSALS
jgi:hypothetical protein